MEYVTNETANENILPLYRNYDEFKEVDKYNEDAIVIEKIAETQGEIYELAYEMGYDLKDFSDKYLNSDFCRFEMDSPYSIYQLELNSVCMERIDYEFEYKGIKVKKRDTDAICSPMWLGQVYRYLYYKFRTSSRELAIKVPFDVLASYDATLQEYSMDEAIEYLVSIFCI